MTRTLAGLLTAAALFGGYAAAAEAVKPAHGLAMHGEPKYKAGFTHFDYVSPNAPKGGTIRLGAPGTFDSFNGFIIRGTGVALSGLMYDTLMTSSSDEAFSEYGVIAETVETPKDRSWVAFNLRKEAKFHDGKPVTADDVVFSFNLLVKDGSPFYAFYYGSVAKVTKEGTHRVKFTFKPGENRELPLILGQMPVLPKHYWEKRDFKAPTLDIPVGSGPYKIERFEAGRWVVFKRDPNYWGRDIPVNKGQYNFDRIRVDYFRDATVLREALKSGRIDYRAENQAKAWARDYNIPAKKKGQLIYRMVKREDGGGMQAFIFNTRREIFKDKRVRRALGYAFDFEFTNRTLFFGQYSRTDSYFENSDLAATGLPKGEELKILERFRGQIPDEVFTKVYTVPTYKNQREKRQGLRQAFRLLKQAGWTIKNGNLTHGKTGKVMRFELLTFSQEFERILLPFAKDLKRLGVTARVRLVDPSQYQNRIRKFDFDVTTTVLGQSLSPGNEQRDFWSSRSAKTNGSRNLIGIQNKAIDAMIELIIAAPDRKALRDRTRAMDRVLLWNHYVIPQWHIPAQRLVYWDKFGTPGKPTLRGESWLNWWVDPKKEAALAGVLKSN